MKNFLLKICNWLNWFEPGGVVTGKHTVVMPSECSFYPGVVEVKVGEDVKAGHALKICEDDGLFYAVRGNDTPHALAECDISKGDLCAYPPVTGRVWKTLPSMYLDRPEPIVGLTDSPTALWPHVKDQERKIGAPSALSAPYEPNLAWVLSQFDSEDVQPDMPLGYVCLEDGKLMVTMNNFYDIHQLRNAFGQIEFEALEFLEPPPGLGFEFGGAVKKFYIKNWVLTNVPAEGV